MKTALCTLGFGFVTVSIWATYVAYNAIHTVGHAVAVGFKVFT